MTLQTNIKVVNPDYSSNSSTYHQSLQLLAVLGYETGDKVFVRCLAPKNSPDSEYVTKAGKTRKVKVNAQGMKLFPVGGYITLCGDGYSFTETGFGSEKKYKDGIKHLTELNLKGYGIYFYVNPGGTKKGEVTECRALFFECDGVSFEEQWERIDRLPVTPTIVVKTRNSLHTYYALKESSRGVDGWCGVQERLIQLMESDISIKKENQLLRLPGFNHLKNGTEPVPVRVAQFSGSIYDRGEIESFLPELPQKEGKTRKNGNKPLENTKERVNQQKTPINPNGIAGGFPLEICLSKHSRDLIAAGTPKGSGYTEGFKLACDLIGTAEWLTRHGYNFSGSPEALFSDFARKSLDSYNSQDDIELVFGNAQKTTPTPSLPDEAIENCIKAWSSNKKNGDDWDKWQKFHTFTSKEKVNQQYLDIVPPKKGEILIINSPTNTGKSTLLKKWAKTFFAEQGIIRIGNRNSLELQFCNESDFYHLQSEKDLSDTLLSNPKKRVSFCFPSMIHTNSEHWEDTIIYGDEVDGTIQQALFLNRDPDNLDRFKEALELDDRAVFLSGTLYDHHIDYLRGLCPNKTFRIVQNTYHPQRPTIKVLAGTFREENPDKINSRDKSPLLDRILSEHEPIMIQSDSKHFLNSLERLVKNTPNTDTLLVTSDTLITDKKVQAFIENPNGYIKQYSDKNPTRRLVVFASPTMTSGNDITIKYFKRDYHYYCGQLSSVLISQKIIRIRDTECERIISIPEYITSDDTEKCEYLDQWQNNLIMAEINSLDEPENKAELIKKLTDSLDSPHYKEACITKWIRDFERKNYRDCLIKLLTQQGYDIELITAKKSDSENTKKLKETSEEIKDETSEAIYQASDKYIGKDERSIEPETKDDLMAVEKAKILSQLPNIHESESWSSELVRLVKFDKPRLIHQLNRRYLLHNPHTLKTLTAKRYHRHGQRVSDGKTTDLWRDQNNLAFLTAIEKIGLEDWVQEAIENNTQFTNSDPAVTEIIAKCQTKAISNALGRSPGKDPIKFLSWLLGTLGYDLTAKRVRAGESRGERRYSIKEDCQNAQFLSEITDAIERRYDTLTGKCTTLEWAFLEKKITGKNQTTEIASNPDISIGLVGPDQPKPLIEEIDSSGPKVYCSENQWCNLVGGDHSEDKIMREESGHTASQENQKYWGYSSGELVWVNGYDYLFAVVKGYEKDGRPILSLKGKDGIFDFPIGAVNLFIKTA